MADISDEKWSCSRCSLTVTIYAPPAITRVMLDAAMAWHSKEHHRAAALVSRLPLPKKRAG